MLAAELFDDAFIAGLPPPNYYANPSVVILCRHLHTFRQKVEDWFSHLPLEDKPDMFSRLRSTDDRTHVPALYELHIHEFCRSRSWLPTKNPDVGGLTPDYLVQIPSGTSFYLEVASVFQPPETTARTQQVNLLMDKLNSIEAPFVIAVQLHAWPERQISPARIARNIEHKLKTSGNSGGFFDLSEYGLSGSLLARHSPHSNKAFAMLSSPIGVGLPSIETMKGALKKKINKYKQLKYPYVIAICSTDTFPLNQHTLESVLYGGVTWTQSPILNTIPRLVRDRRGLLTQRTDAGTPLNTRLSAVLFAEMFREDDDLRLPMKLFHNPWAANEKKLDEGIFGDLPQLVRDPAHPGGIVLKWTKDESQDPLTSIFGTSPIL